MPVYIHVRGVHMHGDLLGLIAGYRRGVANCVVVQQGKGVIRTLVPIP